MASINKMSLCGIRSFSPEREETIEFYSPLTMIVGANGCGKTTIIESLKYCCTGLLPPNAKNGQVFVNDPGVTDSTEVKASIKLRFKNKRGHDAVVTRSLQVIKKKNKLEYKALEGVVRFRNEEGETVSLSHKCSELDKHIPDLLGVSAAVMESVIFCHQEESSWPLAEPAVLKKKFDDIFESSRFAKALEVIMKTKKDYAAKSKDQKCEVVELAAYLSTNTDDLRKLTDCTTKKDSFEEDLSRIAQQTERIDEKVEKATEVVRRSQSSHDELKALELEVNNCHIRVSEKSLALGAVLDLTDEEINYQLKNFDTAREAKTRSLSRLDSEAESINNDMQLCRDRIDGLNSQRGEAKAVASSLDSAKTKHQELCNSLARKFALTTQVPSWEPSKARDFSEGLAAKESSLRTEVKGTIATAKSLSDEREKRLNQLKETLQKHNLELSAAEKDLGRVQKERDSSRSELARLGSAKDDQESAQSALQIAQSALADVMGLGDVRRLQAEISELTARIGQLTQAIKEDSELLQDMAHHKEESDRLVLTLKQNETDRIACNTDTALLFERNYDLLASSNLDTPPDSVSAFDDAIKSITGSLKESKSKLVKQKTESKDISEKVAQLSLLKDQVGKKRVTLTSRLNKMTSDKAKIKKIVLELNELRNFFMAGPDPLSDQTSLADIQQEAKELDEVAQDVLHSAGSRKKLFEKLEKTREKANACPCCRREMTKVEEAIYHEAVAKLLNTKHFDEIEEMNTNTLKVKEIVSQLRDVASSLADAESVEQEMAEAEALETQYDTDSNKVQILEANKALEIKKTEDAASSLDHLLLEMNGLRRRLVEIQDKKKDLQGKQVKQSQSISTDLEGRNYASIEASIKAKTSEREELLKKKDEMQADESKKNKRLFSAKTQVTEAEKALLEATSKMEKLSTLQQRFSELDKQFKELNTEKARLSSSISSIQPDVSAAETALADSKDALQRTEQDAALRIQVMKRDIDEFARGTADVENLRIKAEKFSVVEIERDLIDAQHAIDDKDEAVKQLLKQISKIRQDLSNEDQTRKQLSDNLELRRITTEYENLKDKLKALQSKSNPDLKNVEDARREIQRGGQEKQKLSNEEASIRGRLKEIDEQMKDLQRKLQSDTYRNIGERHRRKSIEYETTLMAVADLDSYYHALDSALATYHLLKIKEINKIIRELWQQVYRGDDIDRIEISSDQDSADSAGPAKRSYNYRVVMTKGSVPLDMRGRCSAGQRVLAAIVIRLALAETFCLSCGMLALDEPTTNLDDANRAGLAHALARIISNRSKQLNFQLVCITHDEAFVRLLNNELSLLSNFALPEYYFRIARKEDQPGSSKYFSTIERIAWEDM